MLAVDCVAHDARTKESNTTAATASVNVGTGRDSIEELTYSLLLLFDAHFETNFIEQASFRLRTNETF